MPELDHMIGEAVEAARADGPERCAQIAAKVADFRADDNASMMGGWT